MNCFCRMFGKVFGSAVVFNLRQSNMRIGFSRNICLLVGCNLELIT